MSRIGLEYKARLQRIVKQLEKYAEHPSASDFYLSVLGYNPSVESLSDSGERRSLRAEDITPVDVSDEQAIQLVEAIDGFQGVIQGGRFIHDIVRLLAEFYQGDDIDTPQLLEFYGNQDEMYSRYDGLEGKIFPRTIPSDPESESLLSYNTNPTIANPSIGVILVKNPLLGLNNRQADITTMFMNFLPTHEISRAVPFLDVTLITPQPRNEIGTVDRMSLITFLNPNDPNSDPLNLDKYYDARAQSVLDQQQQSLAEQREAGEVVADSVLSTTGMEIFTSPQTLVNPEESFVEQSVENSQNGGVGSRLINPIDKFRPLVSIKSLQIDVVARAALRHTFKTAKLDLTLHDRGRLPQVARFVKPDLYGTTRLMIEYGWSHPATENNDESNNNLIGEMIGNSRCVEMYKVTNSTFNLSDAGQIDISLTLAMDGGSDLTTTSIAENREVREQQEAVAEINEAIQLALRSINQNVANASDIFGQDFLRSSTSTDSSVSMIADEDTMREIRAFISSNRNHARSDVRSLVSALTDLYGSDDDGRAQNLDRTVDRIIGTKISELRNGEEGSDPWWRPISINYATDSGNLDNRRTVDIVTRDSYGGVDPDDVEAETGELGDEAGIDTKTGSSFVSFGKVALKFIGEPLRETGRFDEVQMIYYPFNERASFIRDRTVAEFPIDLSRLENLLKQEFDTQTNIPAARFVDIINRQFFANQASAPYGLRPLYEEEDNTGILQIEDKDLRDNPSRLLNTMQGFLQRAYGSEADISFSLPSVKVHVESVPVRSSESTQAFEAGKTILRLHFYDERTTAYAAYGELLRAIRSDQVSHFNTALGEIGRPTTREDEEGNTVSIPADVNAHEKLWSNQIRRIVESGVLEEMDASGLPSETYDRSRFAVRGGIGTVKSMVRRSMPSVRYGTPASAITNATMSSMNNPQLTTINMLRSGPNSSNEAPGVRNNGLPLWISPTEVSLDMIGCPFAQPGQQFFIDFDTNTTADNIYAINTVQHSIKQGEFKTVVKMLPYSSAYGEYRSLLDNINGSLMRLQDAIRDQEEQAVFDTPEQEIEE